MIFSLILQTATRVLVPLMLLFSIFLLLRGHHMSGGGFIGGLVGAGGFVLYAIAYGVGEARRALPMRPEVHIALGLGLALASGVVALVVGDPFLTGEWLPVSWAGPLDLTLGTPLLFDVGVYFVVIGVVLSIVFSLEERGEQLLP